MKAGMILFINAEHIAAVDRFTCTRFGAFRQRNLASRFTAPSQTVFLLLVLGFVPSSVRHTVANDLRVGHKSEESCHCERGEAT